MKIVGLPTGFRDLDKLTLGLHSGCVFVIAGRPLMGKTALAMNIVENITIDLDIPVGVFSLNLSAKELVMRSLHSRGAVNLQALKDGFSREYLTAAATELIKAPMYIDDTPELTINQLRTRAQRMCEKYKIKLLVIDYIQVINRRDKVADISSGIKLLAKELDIPIIVLSQLNRQPESRAGGKPRLRDLRQFDSLEQEAAVVGLLMRSEVDENDAEKCEKLKGQATLTITKQPSGTTGKINLNFRAEYNRFENVACDKS